MSEYLSVHTPEYLPEDDVLCINLRRQGAKEIFKTLSKLRKGTYPITEGPLERSFWWMDLNHGKKKAKAAVRIMASEYEQVIKRLDNSHRDKLELEIKIQSQRDELNSFRLKVQQQEAENMRLIDALDDQLENSCYESQITSLLQRIKTQEIEKKILNDKVLQQAEIIKNKSEVSLRDSETIESLTSKLKKMKEELDADQKPVDLPIDFFQDSDMSLIPVSRTYQDIGRKEFLLDDLPDLQRNHSNYSFWNKVRYWFQIGCRPSQILQAVLQKCPSDVRIAVKNNLSQTNFSDADRLGPDKLMRLIKDFHSIISKNLGAGTNQFVKYYLRRQMDGESFRKYSAEKFKLYCAYGVDKTLPDQNDLHFLYNVIEKASRRYQVLLLYIPKSYNDMLMKATVQDSMLMEHSNECFNCGRSGHTKVQCRRPGGDAEAEPNQCYTCGGYNHWARECWWRKNQYY